MPDFFAFAGLRYDCDAAGTGLEALAAPPYDVIDEDRRAALEAAAPAQRGAVAAPPRRAGQRAIATPARPTTLARWEAAGVLVRDATPRLYSYRMAVPRAARRAPPHARRHRRARAPRGRRSEPAPPRAHRRQGQVRPPRAAPRDARQRRPDLGPQPRRGPDRARSSPTRCSRPASTPTASPTRSAPSTTRTASPRICAQIGGSSVVLADGHHRFETACAYRDELRAAGTRRRRRGRHHDARRRAGRRRARHRADPPLARAPRRRRPARARLADGFEVVDVAPYAADRVDDLQQAMADRHALGIVDRDGLALAVPAARRARAAALADEDPRSRRPTPRSSKRW